MTDPQNAPYWEGAARGELVLPRCAGCRYLFFPPSNRCTECLGADLRWTRISGAGTVFSYVVYHRAWRDDFKDRIPYNVAVVELAEGPHLVTSIVGCALEDLKVGMSVTVQFVSDESGVVLPMFAPTSKP